jgi:hypothetical protein
MKEIMEILADTIIEIHYKQIEHQAFMPVVPSYSVRVRYIVTGSRQHRHYWFRIPLDS